MANMTDYLEDAIVDWLFRGQAFTPPATMYIGLFTVAPTDAGGGTEVSGGGYARVAVGDSLTNWAGTQGAGSTTGSAAGLGTSGTTSNNNPITFPAPTAAWGSIVAFGIFDALTGGNLLFYASLTTPKTVNSGDAAPSFGNGALTVQIDN